MKRFLVVLGVYLRLKFLVWMAGRSFLLNLVANQAVAPFVGLAIWTTVRPNTSGISTYYVALLAVQLLTVSYEQHTFSNGIYSGALADDLLKPHPVVLIPLGENLAMRLWHFVLGLPLLLAVGLAFGVHFDPSPIALAVPALLGAAILRFLFSFTLSLAAFWTEQAHGVVGFGETLIFLLGGAAAPVALLPGSLRPIGESLPFRAMLGFPAEIAAGTLSGSEILVGYAESLVWIGCFLGLATVVWHAGIRRFTAVGG